MGGMAGVAGVVVGGMSAKWVVVIAAAVCVAVGVIAAGSLRKPLVGLLVFSLAMQMELTPGWSDR